MLSIACLSHKFTDIQAIIFDKDGTSKTQATISAISPKNAHG
jgi:hypothetical protein